MTINFPKLASVGTFGGFQLGFHDPDGGHEGELVQPPPCGKRPSAHVPDASASTLILTGRGSFRPIQSSLTKAALSRPIVPKVLPPQAPGHLASKSLRLCPGMKMRPAHGLSPLGRVSGRQETKTCTLLLLPGAIDLAAKSAGIIPGSPLPVLDADGLSGISPLSSDEVTVTVSGQDSTGTHQNGDPLPAVGVSVFRRASLSCHQLLGWNGMVSLQSWFESQGHELRSCWTPALPLEGTGLLSERSVTEQGSLSLSETMWRSGWGGLAM